MQHSTLPMTDRQALTMTLLEQVTPYLRQSARRSELDFEDLYQDASVKIMQILDHYRDHVRHLHAYVLMSMHNLVINKSKYTKRRRSVSLNDLLLDDVSFALADGLPDLYRVDPVTVILVLERLEELESCVEAAKHHMTRRKLREMHATALAVVSIEKGEAHGWT